MTDDNTTDIKESVNAEITQDLSVEQAFEELEKILNMMQDTGVSLEESFAAYEKGMKLIRYCSSRIDSVEKRIEQLNADGSLSEFEAGKQEF